MAEPQSLNHEQAIATWTELQRRISVGAYEERSAEHHETGTWPDNSVEESLFNLENWATKQGLEFCWDSGTSTWSLPPIQARSGECVECGRFSSLLSPQGYCEGCVMQAAIDAQESEASNG